MKPLHRGGDGVVEAERHEIQLQSSALDDRQVQDVVDKGLEPSRLGGDGLKGASHLYGGSRILGRGALRQDRAEWRSKFVGDVGKQLAPQPVRLLEGADLLLAPREAQRGGRLLRLLLVDTDRCELAS